MSNHRALCALAALAALFAVARPCEAQSITLSPAVVPLAGSAGQGVTQTLTLQNDSDVALPFVLEARDVIVQDGRRSEIEAGRMAGSIAASAVFSQPRLTVPPHSSAQVQVTLTLPPSMPHRAVNVYLRGAEAVQAGKARALLSLGTLFTFALSDAVSLQAQALEVSPPDASDDLRVRWHVANDGTEPVVPDGVVAILSADGRLQGRMQIAAKRLLPGEATQFEAAYPGELPPGTYQVVATLDAAGHAITRNASVAVR